MKIISFLLQYLPNHYDYQVVFMQRNLDEVLQSQQKMLKSLGEQTDKYAPDEMAQQYRNHLRLVMQWLERQPNVSVLYVNHRDVIDDPLTQVARIEAFLKLGLDLSAMAMAVNADLYRNKEHSPVEEEP